MALSPGTARPTPPVGRFLLAALVALGAGVLTAYAQGWLPDELASLANSSGSWVLVAFLLALVPNRAGVAAGAGSVALLLLLAGYVVGAGIQGYPSSTQLMLFWGAAAVLVGPVLGLGAYWVRHRDGVRTALGAAAVSGVLVGEGVYGLRYIADSTYPPYWAGQIVVGVLLLLVVVVLRVRRAGPIALAVGATALTAALFVVAYSGDLFVLFA